MTMPMRGHHWIGYLRWFRGLRSPSVRTEATTPSPTKWFLIRPDDPADLEHEEYLVSRLTLCLNRSREVLGKALPLSIPCSRQGGRTCGIDR